MTTLAERIINEEKGKWIKEGEKAGVQKVRREIAGRMVEHNVPIEKIARCLDLKVEEVKKLI